MFFLPSFSLRFLLEAWVSSFQKAIHILTALVGFAGAGSGMSSPDHSWDSLLAGWEPHLSWEDAHGGSSTYKDIKTLLLGLGIRQGQFSLAACIALEVGLNDKE
jgi:hypothetical protein